MVIDGFTLRNGTRAGIAVDDSPGTIIENCTFESNPGDGVRFTGFRWVVAVQQFALSTTRALVSTRWERISSGSSTTPFTTTPIRASRSAAIRMPHPMRWWKTISSIATALRHRGGGELDAAATPETTTSTATVTPQVLHGGHMTSPWMCPPCRYSSLPRSTLRTCISLPGSPAVDAGDPATPASLLSWLQQGTTQSDCTPDPESGGPWVPLPDHGPKLSRANANARGRSDEEETLRRRRSDG